MGGARGWSVDAGTPRMRGLAHHGWRRLGFRRQFVLMLVAATLLCTAGMAAAAYVGARANAIAAAQAREAQDLRVAWQVLGAHGSGVVIHKGQLQTTTGYVINGDHAVVDQISTLAGDQAAIYQAENNRLVLVASDLHTGTSGALGSTLNGPAYQAVLGNCLASPAAAPDCHAGYRGAVTIQRTGYIAAVVPLLDAQGNLVGALEVATPADAIEAPLRTLAGLLLLSGLALMALFIVIGLRVSGPISRRAFTSLAAGLDGIDGVAARLGTQARTQASRAGRQAIAARHLTDELRTLNELAAAIENGAAMLQEATGSIWAELSHPGATVDAQTSLRAARHTAVIGGELGVSAERAFELCRRMRTTVNHLIAESGALRDCGDETALAAADLRDALERAEAALGNRPAPTGPMPTGPMPTGHVADGAEEPAGNRDRFLDRARSLASPAIAALATLAAWLGGSHNDALDDASDVAAVDDDDATGTDASARHAPHPRVEHGAPARRPLTGQSLASGAEHAAVRAPRRTRPIDLPPDTLPPDASGARATGYTVLGSVGAWPSPGGARELRERHADHQTGSSSTVGQAAPSGEHHAPEFHPPRERHLATSERASHPAPTGTSGQRPDAHLGDQAGYLPTHGLPGNLTSSGKPTGPAYLAHPAHLVDPADPGRTGPGWRSPAGLASTSPAPTSPSSPGGVHPTAPGRWNAAGSGHRGHTPDGGERRPERTNR